MTQVSGLWHRNVTHTYTPCTAHLSDSSTLQPPRQMCHDAENMKLPPRFRHLRFQLADVDTQNVTPYFNASYDFIEEARAAGHGVWRPPHDRLPVALCL